MIVSGSVKFFNEERGYGFVLPDQPLGDAFFHIASLRKMGIPRVIPGQRAVFEISIAPGRGLRVERFFLIHSGAPEQCALASPSLPAPEAQAAAGEAKAEGNSALCAA
ncbi:MAG: cold shock domain-containing protein [Rhizobiales bacterium]|nr:cold shock domain-containing protein [Hyphomicrobiales bacterium]